MTAAVIQATFADWRTVKGRKQLQLIFEVPLERQAEILTTLGAPNAAEAKWCAIALLDLKGGGSHAPDSAKEYGHSDKTQPSSSQAAAGADKERRAWATLTPTVQAGIRCQDPIFQAYVIEQRKFEEVDDMEDNAACFVRRQCNVNTRGALATNQKAATVWRSIDDDFIGWKHAESM